MRCHADAKTCAAIFLAALTIAACGRVSLPGSDHLTATAKAERQPTELNKQSSTATASVEQTLEAKANPTQKPDSKPSATPAPRAFILKDKIGDCDGGNPTCSADLIELRIYPAECSESASGFYVQEDPFQEFVCPSEVPETVYSSGFVAAAFAPPGALGEDFVPILICLNLDEDGEDSTGLQSGPERGIETSLCLSTDGGEAVLSYFSPEGDFIGQELLIADEMMRVAESVVTIAVPDLGISEIEKAASAVMVTACAMDSATGALSCDRAGWSCVDVDLDETNPAMLPDCRTSIGP